MSGALKHAGAGSEMAYLDAIQALYGIDIAVPDTACPEDEIDAESPSL